MNDNLTISTFQLFKMFPDNEFTFRLNEGNVKRHTFQRLNSLIAATAKRRITYKELTA